jgi:SAM-dependent methyltransferase
VEVVMDIWKFFAVGHTNHVFYNPMSEAKFDEMIERLALPRDARMLDVACGPGELLVRLARRWGTTGVGVDLSPYCVKTARANVAAAGLAGAVEITEGEGNEFEGAPESFDLVSCIGASWIFGGHRATLDALSTWAKPGGLVMVGEPFFTGEPSPEYLKVRGMNRESFGSHRSNVLTGVEQGLGFLYTIVSTQDDWDRYEGLQCDAAERYARDNPEDPDASKILSSVRKQYGEYLRWGRDELSWAVYLFLKGPSPL